MGLKLIIDPNNAPLELTRENGYVVFSPLGQTVTQAEKQWASNADSEGDKAASGRPLNIEITPRIRITDPGEEGDEEAFRMAQLDFEGKIHKLQGDEGGVLRIVFDDETFIDWEVRDVTGGEALIDNRFVHYKRTEGTATFVCAPYGTGEEELVGTFEMGTAKFALECLLEDIPGTAPALARAVVTSPEADMWDVKWGRESRRYSAASTAKLLYAPADLTPLGGATVTTETVEGKAGTAVLKQATLTPNWTAMASTQMPGIGHMTHEGEFEVLVWVHMPAANTGELGIGFEYGVGDLIRRTELDPTYFEANHPREGKIVQLSLGQVFLDSVGAGTHLWEGRVLAKSTVSGDDLSILAVGIRPLEEGNGRLSITPALNQPAALLIRDEFDQVTGVLNGKTIGQVEVSSLKSPTTLANDASVGSVAWTNPSNAGASDGAYAQAVLEAGKPSQYLKATKFAFAIPVGAVIKGIVAEVEVNGDEKDRVKFSRVRIVKGGAVQATERTDGAFWPDVNDAYATFGSPTDLWGAAWASTDINAEGFGIALQAETVSSPPAPVARIDHIRLTVYYADAAGQTWVTSGDAVDTTVDEATHVAKRSEVSDADINTGRYAVAGTNVLTNTVVGIKAKRGTLLTGASERIRQFALARYVDNSNWFGFGPDVEAPSVPVTDRMRVVKRVAGTVTELQKVTIPSNVDYRSVYLQVDSRGRYFCWGSLLESGIPRLLATGHDTDLAAGGTLDDGKVGFYDAKTGALANQRIYDQFVAWVPPLDAIIFSGLSLELTDSIARREASSGGAWAEVVPEGDYLQLEPEGMGARKNRLLFVASPNDPDTMGVGHPKKVKVEVYATPRWRGVPEPA